MARRAVMAATFLLATTLLEGANSAVSAATALTAQNYEAVLSSTAVSVVAFVDPNNAKAEVAPKQEVETAAALLQQMITVGFVDVQQEKELTEMFNISDTPSLRIVWKGGIVKEFNTTAFTAKEIVYTSLSEWLAFNSEEQRQLNLKPAVHLLETGREVAQMITTGSTSAIGFFSQELVNSTERHHFHHVAKAFRDGGIIFGEIANGSLSTKMNVTKLPSVSIYNPEVGAAWLHNITLENLANFVNSNRGQYLSHLTQDNLEEFNKQPSVIVLTNLSETSAATFVLSLRSIAMEFSDHLRFFYADSQSAIELAQKFGLGQLRTTMAVWDPAKSLHFNFPPGKPVTKSAALRFCAQFAAGKLAPTFKSAPRPTTNDDAVITEVVSDTFRDTVSDSTADVVVLLYSKRAPYVADLLSVYVEVAKALHAVDGVILTKMDVDANDLFPGSPTDVPSITIYPMADKKPVSFQGPVRFNHIMHFLSRHATNPIEQLESEAFTSKNLPNAARTTLEKLLVA